MNMFKNKDKSSLSLPTSKKVCGYEIKKMPLAPYLVAIERLRDLPEDFMDTCFPNKEPSQILELFIKLDKNSLAELLVGVFITAPKYIISLVSDLTGISEDLLLNDSSIGIDGMIEIIDAFIEVNNLGKSLSGVLALKAKIFGLTKAI